MLKTFFLILISTISHSVPGQSQLKSLLPFPPQEIVESQNLSALKANQISQITRFLDGLKWEEFKPGNSIIQKVDRFKISVLKDSNSTKHDEFSIELKGGSLKLAFQSKASFHYLKNTTKQILKHYTYANFQLKDFVLNDWADFEKRGYMLDISRDKVPTMRSMYLLVAQLSQWRINELQLYTEHTFAYQNHKVVWENSSPFTAIEIQKLDAYCLNLGIDLVPNQNSFGHLENWLKHDEYLALSECETDCKTKWGKRKRTSLAPTNPNSLKLVQELYAELLPNFKSPYFNIGGDETLELCLGKSKAECDHIGKGKVYLNFLIKLNAEANKHGKISQFWGDIILNHPELISEIPKNMVPLVWGYDATYPFDKNLPAFKSAGLDFYVCPGTSSWRSEIGKNYNAFINLKKAAVEGKKNNATGYLITDWGDYGHFQPRSISYAPLFLGASYAWNYQESSLVELEQKLNDFIFEDASGFTAKALLILGNAYQKANIPEGNSNAFHLMIRRFKWTLKGNYQTREMNKAGLLAAENEIDKGLQTLAKAQPLCEDYKIILQETIQAASLAKFGIHLGLARLDANENKTKNIPVATKQKLAAELKVLIENHKKLWLLRNRPGGLKDSAEKLEDLFNYLQ